MISFDEIKSFFADTLRRNPSHFEYMLKEYFHYRMLDIIFSGEYASKLSFIGSICPGKIFFSLQTRSLQGSGTKALKSNLMTRKRISN